MQVGCPECGKVGLLQTITSKHHRVRHDFYVLEDIGLGRRYRVRKFAYCRVSSQWALEQINAEKQREEAEYRRIMGIK